MRKILAMQETTYEVFDQLDNTASYKITDRIRGKKTQYKPYFFPRENREKEMTRNVLNNLVLHMKP